MSRVKGKINIPGTQPGMKSVNADQSFYNDATTEAPTETSIFETDEDSYWTEDEEVEALRKAKREKERIEKEREEKEVR